MYTALLQTIKRFRQQSIHEERKSKLQPLIDFIQKKVNNNQDININFICTHNSRRSHLSQVWAQVSGIYFNIPKMNCYSGGTEETEVFPLIIETLRQQGFQIKRIFTGENPIYFIKYDENIHPIIGFSKKYDDPFNPASNFAAVMTCSQADGECPFIPGAETRISVPFEDPKISDHTSEKAKVYFERSQQIGAEMFYVFSNIK